MNPVRLYPKQPTNEEKMEKWLLEHSNVVVPILLGILLVLVAILTLKLAFMFVGSSAVETGKYYYHLIEMV